MTWLQRRGRAADARAAVYVCCTRRRSFSSASSTRRWCSTAEETADNLKKSGAFVPGIRPGDQTARYIDKILMRLTLAGAIYIALVCLLPEFLIAAVERAVLFRRNVAADHRRGDDGLHGAGAGVHDVAAVRERC